MNTLERGQIVKSKAGRDLGKLFVIIDIKDEYLYLVDGTTRRLDNPKKKKRKHVQPVNHIIDEIKSKLTQGEQLNNAEIRKQLSLEGLGDQ